MKICKFCNTENDDSARICTACGGNEFKNKCNNCGTVFDNGEYCPKCSVKAGTKAKICPNCKTEYFTNACPNCGYINNPVQPVITNGNPAGAAPKRKTWLWVLGWIFIFPVPLTILMIKNQNLKKGIKIAVIAAAWTVYLLIGIFGGTDSTTALKTPEVSAEAYAYTACI